MPDFPSYLSFNLINDNTIAQSMEANIIIIGAGISALAAAQKLAAKHGHRVLILEARDRIGGRIQSMDNPFPCHIDLGAT